MPEKSPALLKKYRSRKRRKNNKAGAYCPALRAGQPAKKKTYTFLEKDLSRQALLRF
jgi:hypothetical protein